MSGDAASAAANQVALTLPSERSYLLSTTSASGKTFTYRRTDSPEVERAPTPGSDW